MVGKDEVELKNIAQQFPSQATVIVANIKDDFQCKVSLKTNHNHPYRICAMQ